jgi:hypothetical protein
MKRKKRSWLRFILVVLLAGGVYLLLRNVEQQSIYHPSATLTKTPQDIDLAFDNIILTTSDGVNIHGWFIPQSDGEETNDTDSAAPTLLFFHGADGNLSDRLGKLHFFHDLGLDVLAIDYRGYGKSGGAPVEHGLAEDATAAYFYLVEQRGVKPERLYLYGEDLGAAVAIDLAARTQAAGLITEGASGSAIERMERDWPLIPWQYLLRNKFDSLTKIRAVRMPVLIIHSVDDEVVSLNESRRLFTLAREPHTLVETHGSHKDAFLNSFDAYYDALSHFIHGAAQPDQVAPKEEPAIAPSSTEDPPPSSEEPLP